MRPLLQVLSTTQGVLALAHITGGGYSDNLPRVLGPDIAVSLDLGAFAPTPVFSWLAAVGNIAEDEMLRTFNCGFGMAVFVAAQRDLANNQFLNTEYGLGYEDECIAISLAYRRKYTEDLIQGLPPSSSVILRFNLKTGDTTIQPFSLFPKDVFALTHP